MSGMAHDAPDAVPTKTAPCEWVFRYREKKEEGKVGGRREMEECDGQYGM